MTKKKTCAVIGSGIGGIAAAIRLAAKGYKVEVFESNSYAGGKIRQSYAKGYRFDMGPSIITLPHLIDELFELHNKNPRDYFNYKQLEKPFKYFFPDGVVINSFADINRFSNEIAEKTKDSKESFKRYLKSIKTKYDITKPVFIESSIHRFKDFLKKDFFYGVVNFHKIDAFTTMDEDNKHYFQDSHIIELLNYYATYVGSNPFQAPATLNVIPHVEIGLGLFMPKKGVYSMIEALIQLANEVGVKFHFNTRIDEIIIKNKIASGVRINNDIKEYNVIVSNMDVYFTYQKLLPNNKGPQRILNQPKSSSVIGFYWGINREYQSMELHNMFFSSNQKEEYETVFHKKTIYKDPTLYIYISSKHVNKDAPKGSENWFVLINAPNNEGQNWEELIKESRKFAIKKINTILNTSIEKHIEYEGNISPSSIEVDYSSAFGSVYGNSSNKKFAAFLRHANFSRKVKNLYFVGGSVHPGAGIPMCLNSAKIMEQVMH
ncbi:MAG: phytoene desaturase family protein [Cyclobacteriaceae bacterium]|nr:phytoene desaturase family protein [Cyclobacteriaceae bacterium]